MLSSNWITLPQVAKYLGVSKETIYRMTKAKTIPCVKLGKLWLFNKSTIDAWLLSKMSKPK